MDDTSLLLSSLFGFITYMDLLVCVALTCVLEFECCLSSILSSKWALSPRDGVELLPVRLDRGVRHRWGAYHLREFLSHSSRGLFLHLHRVTPES